MLQTDLCSTSSGHRGRYQQGSKKPITTPGSEHNLVYAAGKLHTQRLFGSFNAFVHIAALIHETKACKHTHTHTHKWLTCGHGEVLEAACPTSRRLNGGLFCLDCFHSNTKHNKKHTSGQVTAQLHNQTHRCSTECHRCKYECK